ncbi:MAG: hypothetical protein AB7V42_05870 [Thermoleophilia bacterium]
MLGASALFAGTASAATVTDIPTSPQPQGIVAAPDGLYFVTFDGGGSLHRIVNDVASGSLAGDLGGGAFVTAGPSGSLWTSGYGSRITRYAGGTPTAFDFPPTPPTDPARNFRGIAQGSDGIYAAAKDYNLLYRVDATTGAGTPIALPGGRTSPEGVAASPDGGTIYVAMNGGEGGLLRVQGGTVSNYGPERFKAYGVAVTSDGTAYLTNAGDPLASAPPTVTQVVPGGGTGFTAELPAGSNPKSITVGPDGALWFAQGDNKVGRVTTSNARSEIDVPGCLDPTGIAATSSAVYVTCFGASKIVKIVPDGLPGGGPGTQDPGPGNQNPGPGDQNPPQTVAVGKFAAKKAATVKKAFAITVTFNTAVTKNRVKVEYRSANIKKKGAIKKYRVLSNRLITGTRSVIKVKFPKVGVYSLRVSYTAANGKAKVIKTQKVTVKAAAKKGAAKKK